MGAPLPAFEPAIDATLQKPSLPELTTFALSVSSVCATFVFRNESRHWLPANFMAQGSIQEGEILESGGGLADGKIQVIMDRKSITGEQRGPELVHPLRCQRKGGNMDQLGALRILPPDPE